MSFKRLLAVFVVICLAVAKMAYSMKTAETRVSPDIWTALFVVVCIVVGGFITYWPAPLKESDKDKILVNRDVKKY